MERLPDTDVTKGTPSCPPIPNNVARREVKEGAHVDSIGASREVFPEDIQQAKAGGFSLRKCMCLCLYLSSRQHLGPCVTLSAIKATS